MGTTSLTTTRKSFWQRPEGTTGMVMVAIGGVLGALGLYKLLPFVITLLQNTLHTIFLGVGLVIVLAIVTNKRVWALGWYVLQLVSRWLTSLVVDIDPIGVMRTFLSSQVDRLEEIEKQLGKLRGLGEKLERSIQDNERANEQDARRAEQARERGDVSSFRQFSSNVGVRERSNVQWREMVNKLERVSAALGKIRDACKYVIGRMQVEIQESEKRREATKAFTSAFRSAWAILRGEGVRREMYDEAAERVADDYANIIGEIDNLVDLSSEFVNAAELDQDSFADDMLKRLDELDTRTEALMSGKSQAPRALLSEPAPASLVTTGSDGGREPVAVVTGGQFDHYFDPTKR